MFVTFFDPNIVVSPANVQFREYMGSSEAVREVCNERKGVLILDGVRIDASVVLYGS